MKTSHRTLALIPARGGSKRIHRKNQRPFLGRPIITYSIAAALGSEIFDEVMVSTDDEEIAQIARTAGARVPFFRSSEAANDHAGLAEVVVEVLHQYKSQGIEFATVCCILATAPFVTSKLLQDSFASFERAGNSALLPVVRFSYPIQRAMRLRSGTLKMLWPQNYSLRSQDLEPRYHDAGMFYFTTAHSVLNGKILIPASAVGFEVSENECQDIDSETDWFLAECKYEMLMRKGR